MSDKKILSFHLKSMTASAFREVTERWSLSQLLLWEAEPSLHIKVVNYT